MFITRGLCLSLLAGTILIAACGDNLAPKAVPPGQQPQLFGTDALKQESIFGPDGVSVLPGNPGGGTGIAVNKHLWSAALDTLKFLPLASTDPFSGVIVTEWGSSPTQPNERFKVTTYFVDPSLRASSVKVAVFREVRDEGGAWVTAVVDPQTPRKLEDAILVRARQLRIAEIEGNPAG